MDKISKVKSKFEKAIKEYAYRHASTDDMLVLIAKCLEINTIGKSREEIFEEIITTIKAMKSSSYCTHEC